jgi:lipopolysaccharide biosynthesis glycosyltransferase
MPLLQKITLVTVTDNHYLILLGALIKSIETNLNKDTGIDLWIIDDNITKSNKAKLEQSVNPLITSLHWMHVNDVMPKGIKLPVDYSSWPANIYLRFFIPEFIPANIEKVLFMDVDMINYRDLNELWQTDLGDNIAAAVQDQRVKTFDNEWGGVLNYKDLGFQGDTKYFNSGLLLINIERWRNNNISELALEYISKYKKFAFYPDQYGLNIALADKWKVLDPKWNRFVSNDVESVYNLHFVGRKPIYKSYNNNPAYSELFYKFLNMTKWKGTKPITEVKRYFKKFSNTWNKAKTIFK